MTLRLDKQLVMVVGEEKCIILYTWIQSQILLIDYNKPRFQRSNIDSPKRIIEIGLWHASFGYLKRLFPNLFKILDMSIFKCEVCEVTKSHNASFLLILNRSPFMVIHFDIWGLSKVPTLGEEGGGIRPDHRLELTVQN